MKGKLMSCKSAIYTVLNSATSVVSGSTIPLGSVIRRFGPNIQASGNNLNVEGSGYYEADVSITLSPTTIGTSTVSLFKDGVAIPGATASASVSTAGNPVNLNISSLMRLFCEESSSLSLVLTGNNATVNNVAFVLEKI
jgi:hypothetical protein